MLRFAARVGVLNILGVDLTHTVVQGRRLTTGLSRPALGLGAPAVVLGRHFVLLALDFCRRGLPLGLEGLPVVSLRLILGLAGALRPILGT